MLFRLRHIERSIYLGRSCTTTLIFYSYIRSFWDRDEAYALIKGLIDKAKGIESHDEVADETPQPSQPASTTSDQIEEKRVYDNNRNSGKVVVGQVVDVKPGPVEAVQAAGVKSTEKVERTEEKAKPRSGSNGSKTDETEVNTGTFPYHRYSLIYIRERSRGDGAGTSTCSPHAE